jgi:hypothetical protein
MAEKPEPSFEEAITNDWKNAYQLDIVNMSPVQKFALKQAWASGAHRRLPSDGRPPDVTHMLPLSLRR